MTAILKTSILSATARSSEFYTPAMLLIPANWKRLSHRKESSRSWVALETIWQQRRSSATVRTGGSWMPRCTDWDSPVSKRPGRKGYTHVWSACSASGRVARNDRCTGAVRSAFGLACSTTCDRMRADCYALGAIRSRIRHTICG